MDFMICAHGDPSEEKFIPHIKEVVDGVELQNYGLKGSKSIAAWNEKLSQHKNIAKKLPGRLAVHGPFFGMDYTCQDHLVRAAVKKRLDMTYQMVCELKPDTLVLHARWSEELGRFSLGDNWIEENAEFWKNEIIRFTKNKTRIVLENVMEQSPEMESGSQIQLTMKIWDFALISDMPIWLQLLSPQNGSNRWAAG